MNQSSAAFDNPFATRWVAPGALSYLFPVGESAVPLIERFESLGRRGAIVGPHGCGKSTLLATLLPYFAEADYCVEHVVLRAAQRTLPKVDWRRITSADNAILVIDGWEQLRRWSRWRIDQRCRNSGCGLLATCHKELRLPVLIQLSPDLATTRAVVSRLADGNRAPIPDSVIYASYRKHDGNIREVLFDLYDWYERWNRDIRTNG